jgi:hypothetical protein
MQRVLAVRMSVVVLLASCGPTPTDTTTPADERRLEAVTAVAPSKESTPKRTDRARTRSATCSLGIHGSPPNVPHVSGTLRGVSSPSIGFVRLEVSAVRRSAWLRIKTLGVRVLLGRLASMGDTAPPAELREMVEDLTTIVLGSG